MAEGPKTLILGMGSPILSDDGVGLLIARALEGKIPNADIVTTSMVGLNLLDQIIGYEKLFLIDALLPGTGSFGEFRKLKPNEGTLHLFSSHGLDFFQLFELGRKLGFAMPELGGIYGIEIGSPVFFGEELSPELAEKLPSLIRSITQDIQSNIH